MRSMIFGCGVLLALALESRPLMAQSGCESSICFEVQDYRGWNGHACMMGGIMEPAVCVATTKACTRYLCKARVYSGPGGARLRVPGPCGRATGARMTILAGRWVFHRSGAAG